jgi:hypothetical protein
MPGFTNAERLVLYTHLRGFESDFDKSQSQIRAISAAWSGVVVGAVALVVTNEFTPPNGMAVPDAMTRAGTLAVLRAIVCMIGSAGIYAFWFIDQRIYQRLLHSVFAYGLFLEFKNQDLPQIRSSMFIANLDVTNGLAWFYLMQFVTFLAISLLFALFLNEKMSLIVLAIIFLHFVGVLAGYCQSRKWASLRDLVREVYGNGPGDLAQAMPATGVARGADTLTQAWLERVKKPIPLKPEDPMSGPRQPRLKPRKDRLLPRRPYRLRRA